MQPLADRVELQRSQRIRRTNLKESVVKGFQRYVFAGLVTVIPLAVTWVVFSIVLNLLARVGGPVVGWLSDTFETQENAFASWLLHPWTQWTLAVVLTVLVLFMLGLAASRVIGRRAIGLGHRMLARVPFIEKVYGGAKHFIDTIQAPSDMPRAPVLVEFPHPGMKAIGFVTRTMKDATTGAELAAVYVPAAPVPTSGYLQIVPLDKLVRTNLTFDEAMTFILTGGNKGPELKVPSFGS